MILDDKLDFNDPIDFNNLFGTTTDENHGESKTTARKIRIQTKIRFLNRTKRQRVHELIDALPTVGESLHIVSNGHFDYFTLVPTIIDMENGVVSDFWFSTWTMSHNNVCQIFELFDKGKLLNIHALTGLYFKKREATVYLQLFEGMNKRGGCLFASENHAKVTLMKIGEKHYVIEGSANFTANPRVEQFVICQSKELFDFHKSWMQEIFNNKKIQK